MTALALKVLVGSTRPGRNADRVVPWVAGLAAAHPAFAVEVLDLRDWPLPFFAEGYHTIGDPLDPTYSDPLVKRWNATIAGGDAFVFVTPEYNHSLPAVLKNAIDSVFVSFGFRNKPAAAVGYSGGLAAGVRAVEHLAHVLIEAEAVPLRNAVLIPQVGSAFDDDGAPRDPATVRAATIMLDDLAWWGGVLRRAREEGSLPPAPLRAAALSH